MKNQNLLLGMAALAGLLAFGPGCAQVKQPTPTGLTPTLFLIGDSTVKNSGGTGTNEALGWGNVISNQFDLARIHVRNLARGGRSSRTYFSEGIWDQVLTHIQPGDFVLMQFGHNDGSAPDAGRYRGSLKGVGDETRVVTNQPSGKVEIVHTYGWYLRRFIIDARTRGAAPVVLSPVPQNEWEKGRVVRANRNYGKWARQAARAEEVPFLDLNALVARRYDEYGPEKVRQLFGPDHTHTSPEGARLNASCVAEGLRGLKRCALAGYLLPHPEPFVLGPATEESASPGRN